MRPLPARVLLSIVGAGALAAGIVTGKAILFVVALVAGVLLGTSLMTSRRPLTRALEGFRNRVVDVRLWGAPPPDLPGATLVLTSVNALGAGAHLFFDVQGRGSMHLKIAQPQDTRLGGDSVVVGSARYVQWNGNKLARVDGAPAVAIAVSEKPVQGHPDGMEAK